MDHDDFVEDYTEVPLPRGGDDQWR